MAFLALLTTLLRRLRGGRHAASFPGVSQNAAIRSDTGTVCSLVGHSDKIFLVQSCGVGNPTGEAVMSGIERRAGRSLGWLKPALWLWLAFPFLWPLATPKPLAANPSRPDPERVYRQLRRDPVIRTRQEALKYLTEASPDALRQSAKLAVDERIKNLLAHAGFGFLDRDVQESLHASLLGIRSSFWSQDLNQLSARRQALHELLKDPEMVAASQATERGKEFRTRALRLVEELQMAVTLERCTRARDKRDWEAADYLQCLLSGGPED
jgi:hypothetical protein